MLLEQRITLYQDAELCGCAVRARRGRASAACCSYQSVGLAARAWDEDEAAARGLVGYCCIMWSTLFAVRCSLFCVRWKREGHAAKAAHNASELLRQFPVSLANHEASPVSVGASRDRVV
jgi:hypothetical protein